jgi:hypothetical protein
MDRTPDQGQTIGERMAIARLVWSLPSNLKSVRKQVPNMTVTNILQTGSVLARNLNRQLKRCLVLAEGLGEAVTDINSLAAATPRLF